MHDNITFAPGYDGPLFVCARYLDVVEHFLDADLAQLARSVWEEWGFVAEVSGDADSGGTITAYRMGDESRFKEARKAAQAAKTRAAREARLARFSNISS